jgi:hypothetical protein
MEKEIIIIIFLVIVYSVFVYYYLKKRGKIVILNKHRDNIIEPESIIALPKEMTITIIQDVEVDYEAYSDMTVKVSELLKGDYRLPKKFLKEGRDVVEKEVTQKEPGKEDYDMTIFERIENN